MPDTINTLSCIITSKNTGYGSCTFLPGLIKQALFVPKGFYLADGDSFMTDLAAALLNDAPGARIYPLGDFINITDQSAAPGSQSFNYGASLTTNDGVPKWLFQILNGNDCLYRKMLAFSRSQDFFDVYFIDSNNYILGNVGYVNIDAVKTKVLKPFTMQEIYVPNWSPANSGAIPKYEISFTFGNTTQFRENFSFALLEQDRTNLVGLQDVILSSEILDDDTWGITGTLSCSNENLGSYYGDTFAVASAWSAVNATTGAAIAITSVGYNVTTKEYEILLDSTDPDYPPIGDPIFINLAAPTELYALLALLFEGQKVTVLANT